ncbi:hypothetical protein RDWZM_009695 [Blomia tropicalis]|uniref:Uncharacterized protein n=1 Tax=Blomia tropicalis TaxID=40697 RepID=A0A9Q0M1X0_BLOTA|nr:hypothetical protein RDWZM_009695 [Blomia tropicalis]
MMMMMMMKIGIEGLVLVRNLIPFIYAFAYEPRPFHSTISMLMMMMGQCPMPDRKSYTFHSTLLIDDLAVANIYILTSWLDPMKTERRGERGQPASDQIDQAQVAKGIAIHMCYMDLRLAYVFITHF